MVTRAVAVQADGRPVVSEVLLRKRDARADGDLRADDPVAAVEALGEHVHRAALAVRDTLPAAEQLADDGLDRAATHQSEAVAAVRGDDGVVLGDGVLDPSRDGFLAGRQVAEATDFLFFVEPVGGHFHSSESHEVSNAGRNRWV